MRTATLTPVFWNPGGVGTYPTEYEKEIEQFLADVAADSGKETDFYSLLPQYYEEAGANTNHISYTVTAGTAIQDADALPSGSEEQCTTPFEGSARPCVTDKGVRTELKALIQANGLATGIGHEYIVFFPPGIDSCFDKGGTGDENCSGTGYCGYHGALNAGASEEVEYANEPDNGDPEYKGNCTAIAGKSAAYQTINTTSHEVSESVTDPEVEEPKLSWYDKNEFKTTIEGEPYEFEYGEVGDICAWEFKQGDGALGIFGGEGFEKAQSDQAINGHSYLLQTEWDNAHSTCSISEQTASTKASFTDSATAPVQTGETISFDASASHAPVAIKTYEWNWGDNSQPTVGTSATATHAYTSTGGLPTKSFTVTLKVTDENGNTDTTTQTVEVQDRKPLAAFSLPASLTAGMAATFDGSSSSDPDGTIVSYSWNFGDGTPTVGGATPEHTYTTAGEYTVELTVTDDASRQASTSHTITVATASAPSEEKSGEEKAGEKTGEGGKANSGETTGTTGGSTTTTSTLLTSLPESSKNSIFTTTLPSNALQITLKRNRHKGTMVLTITVSSPGVLSVSDRATHKPLVVSLTHTFSGAGHLELRMTLTQAGHALLRRKHRLTARVLIVFMPTGGVSNAIEKTLHFQLSHRSKRRK